MCAHLWTMQRQGQVLNVKAKPFVNLLSAFKLQGRRTAKKTELGGCGEELVQSQVSMDAIYL